MTERCVNLTQAEARAWAAGATCLIRPLEPVRTRSSVVHLIDGVQYGTWGVGDVLIGREAFRYPDPQGDRVQYGAGTWTRLPVNWLPAIRMPKALARHRRPVVSVRVCRECDVTWDEASAAVGTTPVTSALQWRIAMGYLGHNFGEALVSVTMTEKT